MTLGEKLKEARKQAGLSQEQLSEKLGVSRSAIAKWETDNGIPDVDNLKALSKLLNVSIDYLLDDGESFDELVMRESYNLEEYGKGSKGKRKDRAVREKFPEKDGKQFFVTVTDEFVETRQFAKRLDGRKIEIGNWKFTKCEYEVK